MTTTTTPKIDVATYRRYEEQGLITARTHPTAELIIWNYTQQCQLLQAWDEVTMTARGLITTPDGTIVARPFKKFMNIEQYEGPLPVEPFTVTEKMDGSLGIVYFADGKPSIATRGSFESEQALRATTILHTKYHQFPFDSAYTYLFEIIYPGNRIVVNYGSLEDLVLLAVIETVTGHEIDIQHGSWPFPVLKQFDGIEDIAELKALEHENAEGFVVRFASGLRLKVKFEDYKRLHRIFTQCTARTIWECLKGDRSFEDLLSRVPDEFFAWVEKTRAELQCQHDAIEHDARSFYEEVKILPTRKEQAAIVSKHRYSMIVFRMLDGRDYHEFIWKMLRPQAERPFKVDIDA